MSLLAIRLFPDAVLRKKSRPVSAEERDLAKFLKDLHQTLDAQPGGIGIAAPQVGWAKRIVIVDVSPKDPAKERLVMINPIIRRYEGGVLSREGCMSLPDYTANVKRAAKVWIEWTDERGRPNKKLASGIEAICIQHEMDHLGGILFIDRVGSLKTDVFPRRKFARA